MTTSTKTMDRLQDIEQKIATKKETLGQIHSERKASRSLPELRASGVSTIDATAIHPAIGKVVEAARSLLVAATAPKSYKLVAQGDSWFDYLPSWDIIDWLANAHGHDIDSIAVAGSTINDISYGPVPKNWLGIAQSNDVSRCEELIHRIGEKRPDAILLSGGGNDIAGPEFFSFVNNALSGLPNTNVDVVNGAVNETFLKAYEDLIDLIQAKAATMNYSLPIFVHGYDYPWPDGRGVSIFNLVGPWFDPSFKLKNYPYDDDPVKLQVRYEVTKVFMDAFNGMLQGLQGKYHGIVHYVDLRGTLQTRDQWANELHPKKEGFEQFADKINDALHLVLK